MLRCTGQLVNVDIMKIFLSTFEAPWCELVHMMPKWHRETILSMLRTAEWSPKGIDVCDQVADAILDEIVVQDPQPWRGSYVGFY